MRRHQLLLVLIGAALLILACSRSGSQPAGRAVTGESFPRTADSAVEAAPAAEQPPRAEPPVAGENAELEMISGRGPYADSRGRSQSRASGRVPRGRS